MEPEDCILRIEPAKGFYGISSFLKGKTAFNFYSNLGVQGFIRFDLDPDPRTFYALRSPCCHGRQNVHWDLMAINRAPDQNTNGSIICMACNETIVPFKHVKNAYPQERFNDIQALAPVMANVMRADLDPLVAPIYLEVLINRLEEFASASEATVGFWSSRKRLAFAKNYSGPIF